MYLQNRAYAANQLSDLHQKLTKAQTSLPSTRPPAPILIDEKAVIKQKPQDKNQESALSKAVKDRSVQHRCYIMLYVDHFYLAAIRSRRKHNMVSSRRS